MVSVFDSLTYPSLVMTPDKIIVSGNQVFLDKFKTTLKDIVGKTCHEVFYSAQQCPNDKCPLPMVMAERKGKSILHSDYDRSPAKKSGRTGFFRRFSVVTARSPTFLRACGTSPG